MDTFRPELAEFWPDGGHQDRPAPQPAAASDGAEAEADEAALAALFETVNAARAVY